MGAQLHVCAARVEITIAEAVTLKDRRSVVNSLLERLKGRFNLSVADLDGGAGGAGHAALGVAAVSNRAGHAAETVQKAVEFVAGDGRAEVTGVEIQEI